MAAGKPPATFQQMKEDVDRNWEKEEFVEEHFAEMYKAVFKRAPPAIGTSGDINGVSVSVFGLPRRLT